MMKTHPPTPPQAVPPEASINQPMRRVITPKFVLKVLISLVVLGLLLHYTGLENTLRRLSEANLWYVPLGVGVYLLSQIVSSYRWQFLSAALGFQRSLREFYDYYLIGMFFNLFLPGAIGGDMFRMYYLAKSCNRKKREALLTLLAERGVGLAALLLLTALVALTPAADPIPKPLRVSLVALSALGLIGFLILRRLPLNRWVARWPKLDLLVQAEVYWANLGLLIRSVSISLVVHVVMVGMHVLIASALGVSVSPLYLMAVYGMVCLVSVLPIAFNGIGVREGAYQFLLMRVGLDPETALAFGIYWFLISTCTSLLGGLVLLKGHYKTPSPQDAEAL